MKKIVSFFLIAVMICCMIPASAIAVEGHSDQFQSKEIVTQSVENSADSEGIFEADAVSGSEENRATEAESESESEDVTGSEEESPTETESEPITVPSPVKLDAPKNVDAVVTTKSNVKITWKRSTHADEYVIYRKKGVDGSYKKIANTSSKSYLDKNVKKEVIYIYKVKAISHNKDSYKDSSYSASDRAVIHYSMKAPKVKNVIRTSSGKVKFSWNKIKHAKNYFVYRSAKKKSGYKKIGSTKKLNYTDKTGKANKTYYYKVYPAYISVSGMLVKGDKSNTVSAKVRKKAKRVAYVGDSIMKGFEEYGVIKNTSTHRVIAKVGIQTTNFYNGNLMDDLLDYNPDRAYIMLGMNCLGRTIEAGYESHIIKNYQYILEELYDQNPNIEIVILAVTPVGRNCSVSKAAVDHFNKNLKIMLKDFKSYDLHYLDLAPYLADGDGYLLRSANGGDGIHWTLSAHKDIVKVLKDYVKEY